MQKGINKDASEERLFLEGLVFSVGRGVPMVHLAFSCLYSAGEHTPLSSHTHILAHTVYNLEIKKPFQVQNECSFPSDKSDVNRFADFHFKAAKFVPINSSLA